MRRSRASARSSVRSSDRAIGIIRDGHFWRRAIDARTLKYIYARAYFFFSWLRPCTRARVFIRIGNSR